MTSLQLVTQHAAAAVEAAAAGEVADARAAAGRAARYARQISDPAELAAASRVIDQTIDAITEALMPLLIF